MKRYKRFCAVILCTLIGLVLYNALVWHLCTRQLLTREGGYYTGDLARMGYLSAWAQPRRNIDNLPRRHLEFADWRGQRIDVVTVGDSFSQGGGSGPNRYYQDYLASRSEVGVLNVGPHPGAGNPIETAAILLNSGFLDQVRPKYLLLEIVERNCYKYAGSLDWARTDTIENLRQVYAARTAVAAAADEEGQDLPPVGFINTGNFKWLLYNALYPCSANAFMANTYKVKLDRPLFSGEGGSTLLFLRKDIAKVKLADPPTLQRFNENLNRLAAMLRTRGIELCFMPAVDKYTLYSPYIVDNPYPPSRFFELLSPLEKDYRFVDTQAILARELARGEKDVYYVDDTHWSWKASEAIFAAERFR